MSLRPQWNVEPDALLPEERAFVERLRTELLAIAAPLATELVISRLVGILDRLAPARAEGATMSGQGQGDESDEIREAYRRVYQIHVGPHTPEGDETWCPGCPRER